MRPSALALIALASMFGSGSAVEVPRERPRLASSRVGPRAARYGHAPDPTRFGARRNRRLRNQAARALRGAV